jgi:ribokinase
MKGNRLPEKNESVPAQLFRCQPGGRGLNQAVAAARLGANAALVAMVGNDRWGDQILARLANEGVNCRYVFRTGNASTGATMIMIDEEGSTKRMAAAGANDLLLESHVEQASGLIKSTDCVLAQLGVPIASVKHAFELARQTRKKTMLDAAPPVPLSDEMMRLIDIIRANADEAGKISGVAVTDERSALEAAKILINRGAQIVAIESGNRGNIVVTPRSVHSFSRIPVRPVDRTGAGDAFSAAFVVALLEGLSLERAGSLANAAAAFATTRVGALDGLPNRHELEAFSSVSK